MQTIKIGNRKAKGEYKRVRPRKKYFFLRASVATYCLIGQANALLSGGRSSVKNEIRSYISKSLNSIFDKQKEKLNDRCVPTIRDFK
jgi:hypothetical protein